MVATVFSCARTFVLIAMSMKGTRNFLSDRALRIATIY